MAYVPIPRASEDEAVEKLEGTFDKLANLSVLKMTNPLPGSAVIVGQPITYTITISNTGERYVSNIVVTDTIPTATNLITYSTSQGSITANNNTITATVGPLYPASNTVTITIVASPNTSATDGQVISNKAFINSQPIITQTNTVTNSITVYSATLNITKSASPQPVMAGEQLTYTIVISNSGQGIATNAVVSDTLPANTTFVENSIQLDPPTAGTKGIGPPALVTDATLTPGQTITATFAVTVSRPLTNGTHLVNTASVTSEQNLTPVIDSVTTTVVATPAIKIVKTGPSQVNFGDIAVFTFTITNTGDSLLQITDVVDDYVAPVVQVGGDTNGNGWLDLDESWVYTAPYTVQIDDPPLLVNTGIVTAVDGVGTQISDSDSHSTTIGFNPVLTITKDGPLTANVGETVIFTFTVEHAPGSDTSPVHDILVADDYAGLPALVSNGNGDSLLEFGEQWVYTASYTTKPTNPNPLVNTGTVIGRDRQNEAVTATATHSTALSGFAPVLFVDKQGPTQAKIVETVEYTFIVINYANPNTLALFGLDFLGVLSISPGDGSSINMTVVTDTVAGTATYISGDYNNNSKLDGGEGWIYTATHTITADNPDPLKNTVFANGTDQEGDSVIASDFHSTDIIHVPEMEISRTGPVSATVGQTVNFTFTVKHNGSSDGTSIASLAVNDSIAGTATETGGDTNVNNRLDFTETWTFTANYTVKISDPDPLVSIVTAQGVDEDSDPVVVTTPFSLTISDEGTKKYYLPVIFNGE